ncbi:hypothetical protein EBH_0013970 [Eimeria brunetti]|uniref:Uncharacterized protein n=1 Tax=Eimeria brunetti TaxID=51314 RepID=U6LEF6_9EIME|nr:hypothetical protein EBH_0013970 [Eimeria brunetti]
MPTAAKDGKQLMLEGDTRLAAEAQQPMASPVRRMRPEKAPVEDKSPVKEEACVAGDVTEIKMNSDAAYAEVQVDGAEKSDIRLCTINIAANLKWSQRRAGHASVFLNSDWYDREAEYRRGASNSVADALSRCPYYHPKEVEILVDAANDASELCALQHCKEFSTALIALLKHNQQPVMQQLRGKQHDFKLVGKP